MTSKVRVHELAKALGKDSKSIMVWLKENGEFVKSASSVVDAPLEQKLREAFPPESAAGQRVSPDAPASVTPSTPMVTHAPSEATGLAATGAGAAHPAGNDDAGGLLHARADGLVAGLHPLLQDSAVPLWLNGHGDSAIQSAYRVVMQKLQALSGCSDDGMALITAALCARRS